MTPSEKRCAREEAAERLAELGFAEPAEIDWWLDWADRRRDGVREKLVEGLRAIRSSTEAQKAVAEQCKDRLAAGHADEIRTLVGATLRRARIPASAPEEEKNR
jgi:hypothetical protein